MERKPLVKERVWLLIGQLMCQVEEQAQHIEELEAQLARTNGAADTSAYVATDGASPIGPIGEIPAAT